MLPHRFASSQSSTQRKSRLGDGKPSLLPKPLRPSSMDRLSTEARSTFGASRPSREASATKLPISRRSRSQGDRLGQSYMTPLRSSQHSLRPTTTPQRTPSDDQRARHWQTSLERVLAFVTHKDQRPTSTVAWQRAAMVSVQEGLAARGGPGSDMALVRPLTIARFVSVVGALLRVIARDTSLNTDNYVARLPHLAHRLLYPAPVSKSWLKTVNTLHAFPHALALIAYLLDLVKHVETPLVNDARLYLEKDKIACLRREYCEKGWLRFQEPGCQFQDLQEEYRCSLEALLGNHHHQINEFKQTIADQELNLAQTADKCGIEEEAALLERRGACAAALLAERAARAATTADAQRQLPHLHALADAVVTVDREIQAATAEDQLLKVELDSQVMNVAERSQLQEEVRYVTRVHDSKRALAENIAKMVLSKERELALWQEKTLESCVEYKQGLIHLSAQFPHLASLAVDENELMGAECAQSVSRAVEALRECSCALAERRVKRASERTALARKRAALLDESQAKIAALKLAIEREQRKHDAEVGREQAAVAECSQALQASREKLQALLQEHQEHARTQQTLAAMEEQARVCGLQVEKMVKFIEAKRAEADTARAAEVARRAAVVSATMAEITRKLDQS